MKLEKHFKKLLSEIWLNPNRREKIESAYSTWRDKFKENEELKDIFKEFFQQGSYPTKTAIRPQNSLEFDIDAVLLLNLDNNKEPKETLKLIKNVIESYSSYKGKVKVKDRCVRINYAGDFHMDIVPGKASEDEYIYIPCKSNEEWQKTNPKGFKDWFNEKNSDASYKLSKIVQLVKYWRDLKVGKDTAPKSILLSTLLANNIVSVNSIAETLVLTIENLVQNIDSILDENGQPIVQNPSLEGENLARDWDNDKFEIFKTKLKKFANDIRAALNEEDKDTSIDMWRDIFNTKFPKEILEDEAINFSKFVNASGTLNTSEGLLIPKHRFYGDINEES